jgi:hypothetical protein
MPAVKTAKNLWLQPLRQFRADTPRLKNVAQHTTPFRPQQSEWKEGYRMYICTFPRMQALRIGCAFFVALLSVPLSAQTARTHGKGAQANLRIDVKVVPAIAVHHRDKDDDKDKDKDRGRKADAVSYNLNPRHEEFSVTEETRPMLVDSGNTVRQEQVRSITIVPE